MVTRELGARRLSRLPVRTNARRMRREPTAAELRFWYEVRDRRLGGLKFRRQYLIGPFIADFVCLERRLVVEIDGGQHADRVVRDTARDAFIAAQGFQVVRFWNHEVLTNMDGVARTILAAAGIR
jgi:adenine-specific DNA-methyltransferase